MIQTQVDVPEYGFLFETRGSPLIPYCSPLSTTVVDAKSEAEVCSSIFPYLIDELAQLRLLTQKKAARLAKYGATAGTDEDGAKKAAREAKFGGATSTDEEAKRAARLAKFGGLSSSKDNSDEEAKKAARLAKFGGASAGTSAEEEAKKAARIAKFGDTSSPKGIIDLSVFNYWAMASVLGFDG